MGIESGFRYQKVGTVDSFDHLSDDQLYERWNRFIELAKRKVDGALEILDEVTKEVQRRLRRRK